MEGKNLYIDIDVNSLDLDTTVKMMKMSYSLELWDELIKFSDSLHIRAKSIYENVYNNGSICYNYNKRYLVYYYGYGFLMKGLSLKELERFEESRLCIQQYSDLSWFYEFDQAGQEEIQFFNSMSELNTFEIDLLSGNLEGLEQYVSLLQLNPSEILPGLTNILKAANLYGADIEDILYLFSDPIDGFKKYNRPDSIDFSYFHSFLFELTKYYISKLDFNAAVESTLEILALVNKNDNAKVFRKAVSFFELLRDNSTSIQIDKYKTILFEGAMSNEKGLNFNGFIHSTSY